MFSAIKSPESTAYLRQVAPEKSSPRPLRKSRDSIESLVASRPSSGLRILMALQQASVPVAGGLVAAVLVLYGWSVYTQRSWSQAYDHLTELQQTERELTVANEARKFEVTEQAEIAKNRYVPQGPGNTLFLNPAVPSPKSADSKPGIIPPHLASPIGY